MPALKMPTDLPTSNACATYRTDKRPRLHIRVYVRGNRSFYIMGSDVLFHRQKGTVKSTAITNVCSVNLVTATGRPSMGDSPVRLQVRSRAFEATSDASFQQSRVALRTVRN